MSPFKNFLNYCNVNLKFHILSSFTSIKGAFFGQSALSADTGAVAVEMVFKNLNLPFAKHVVRYELIDLQA